MVCSSIFYRIVKKSPAGPVGKKTPVNVCACFSNAAINVMPAGGEAGQGEGI